MRPMTACTKCAARVWAEESVGGTVANPRFTICCGNSVVSLPQLGVIPRVLELLSGNTNECIDFSKIQCGIIIHFNGVKLDERLANGRQSVQISDLWTGCILLCTSLYRHHFCRQLCNVNCVY